MYEVTASIMSPANHYDKLKHVGHWGASPAGSQIFDSNLL